MSARLQRALCALLVLLVGFALISDIAYRKRKLQRAIRDDKVEDYVSAASKQKQYVDIGVILRCVVADPKGEELIPGRKLRVLFESEHGGILDTRGEPPELVAPSESPRIWHCSEDQYPIILHADELPLGLLIYGSEGAGKTEVMPMWHYFRWLEHIGERDEAGQTAPTKKRLKMFRDAFFRIFPKDWYTWKKSLDLIELCEGHRIQLVSTHQQSKEAGSPLQGFNWGAGCGADEFQDSYERGDDMEARGRSAKGARYKQARTCTAKDTTAWREAKDKLLAARDIETGEKMWEQRKLLGRRSPFVDAKFWDQKKAILSPREYARRVEPLDDLPPELAVFYGWQRSVNLLPFPRAGKDVTAQLLAAYGYESYKRAGAPFTMLAGHDPGSIFNTTVFLRLYVIRRVSVWFVVGELQTKQTTASAHAVAVRKYLNDQFGVNVNDAQDPYTPRCLIFVDPHGRGDNDTDYQTHYVAMQKAGLDVFNPAAISKTIKRGPRIAMTNRLLTAADGAVRLCVAKDDRGNTAAPKLVEAFESLVKRPGDDDPEGFRRKDEDDKTHAPAAVGYCLTPFEQEFITLTTQKHALAAAGMFVS